MSAVAKPKSQSARSQKPGSGKPKSAQQNPGKKASQIKLAFGVLFLLAGVFVCLSIFSYFFTWKQDADLFFSHQSFMEILKSKEMPVANRFGRLGAAISFFLVYKGVGLAALAVGLWFASLGLHILYGRRMAALMRYLRWMSLVVLVAAPILTYLSPDASFAWGGAWGNVAIEYLNGLLGTAGTGLVLIAGICFVLFVIFALDISPAIRRARRAARKAREAAKSMAESIKADMAAKAAAAATPLTTAAAQAVPLPSGNEAAPETQPLDHFQEEKGSAKVYEMEWKEQEPDSAASPQEAVAPPAGKTVNEMFAAGHALKEIPGQDVPLTEPEEAPFEPEVQPEEKPAPAPKPANKPTGLSFEVVHQEEEKPAPIVSHGAHISIEDRAPYAPELDLPNYRFPHLDLLEERNQESIALDKEELEKNKNQIIQTLRSFGIEIQNIKATVGPTVTLYEIVPAEGVRISKIRNLEDDIALNLAALGIRIIAPIPGRGTIGIEVPNANKQIVAMRTLLSSEKFVHSKMSLPIALGKKIDNENYIVDLATMPHLLMAGATGQGKSVGINAILMSLLYKKHPSQLKFVMVDPKKVELSIYRIIEKHFLAKLPDEEEAIITDTKKVINTLNSLCMLMDRRYDLLKDAGTRNIKEYNDKFIARRLNPEKGHEFMPFIVLVVDEFADLIMTAGKEVEMPIARLAQLARAVGIHLIIATQRPSVNVITGTIKANFPARIAFKVSAKVDSRTILDAGGAEQLVGRGDMLISHGSELLRLQCAFVDTPEVEEVVAYIGEQRGYPTAFELPEYFGPEGDGEALERRADLANRDKMFEDCARLVVSTQSGSTSNLQRRFNLGYNRAGRIMDQLEAAGIVGPAVGSKPRDVLVKTEFDLEALLLTLV